MMEDVEKYEVVFWMFLPSSMMHATLEASTDYNLNQLKRYFRWEKGNNQKKLQQAINVLVDAQSAVVIKNRNGSNLFSCRSGWQDRSCGRSCYQSDS